LFGLVQVVSLIFGTQFVPGLKTVFSYAIEGVLFYVLVSEYVQSETDINKLLSAICYGLTGVAALATVEKYWRFNLFNELLRLPGLERDVVSTYPHRILLGYAMVMGVAVAMVLSVDLQNKQKKHTMYLVTLLLACAAYFSMSRGPWLGLILTLVILAAIGGKHVRRKVGSIALFAAALLVLRPGVRDTVSSLYSETFDEDSAKGGSYETRWQLWTIAWKEIQVSPGRFLFGFGPVSTENMDLTDYFRDHEGYGSSMAKIGYTSWDNNYANDLIELGVIGFLVELLLLARIVYVLITNWFRSDPEGRVFQAGVTVGCLIFMFAMTNVFIFSPQLKYLFWALVCIGSISRPTHTEHWAHDAIVDVSISSDDREQAVPDGILFGSLPA
jgi:O-antigen ligase